MMWRCLYDMDMMWRRLYDMDMMWRRLYDMDMIFFNWFQKRRDDMPFLSSNSIFGLIQK